MIGFPSLAATSMEQGRLAARAACNEAPGSTVEPLPFGIYAMPEISFVGPTEEQLTAAGTPYEVGISRYRELARGQILGDRHGFLKLLVSPGDRRLLATHILGTGATELIHLGQCVIAMKGASTTSSMPSSTIRRSPWPTRWLGSTRPTGWRRSTGSNPSFSMSRSETAPPA